MGLFKKDKKAMTFDNAMEERRSIYNLKDSISISDDELESMIAHAVKHVPSSFNSQSTRIVLLLNDNNNKFWDNTKAILKEVMGENRDFEPTEQKIDNFKKVGNLLLKCHLVIFVKLLAKKHLIQWKIVS